MSEKLLESVALSVPLENGWILDFIIRKVECYQDGNRRTGQYSKWYLKKEVNGVIVKERCADERAHILISYVIGRQARIGGPYR